MVVELVSVFVEALAVAAPIVKNIGDFAEGAQRIRKLAGDIVDRFRKKTPTAAPDALGQAFAEVAAMPTAEFDKTVDEIVELQLADQPAEERTAIAETIKLMQDRVRTTFIRPEDPTGTSAPRNWGITRPEDIIVFIPPRPPLFKKGDRVPDNSRWTLEERLGIGGFGEVWKARNREDEITVFKFCLDPQSRDRLFKHERKIIKLVKTHLSKNRHIVRLLDSHLEGDTPWLQYEYAAGGDLQRHFATWPKDLSARATMAVEKVTVLAETMAKCHALQPEAVIHRDLKPANVVIDDDGDYKITDFGISDTQARQALDEARINTIHGLGESTPTLVRWASSAMYASEEQKKGLDSHTADDVHALGVMLYQFVLGDITRDVTKTYIAALQQRNVCRELITLITQAIADREDRYQHAGELAAALRALPKKLIAEPIVLRVEDTDADLDLRIGERYADADAKNAEAAKLMDQRKWRDALTVYQSIRVERMRDQERMARAAAFLDGKRFINALGMEFVAVPKGTFWMGGADGKCGDKQVTIPHDFYLGVYPVTQEEWQKVFPGDTPSYFRKGGGGADKLTGLSDADLKRFPVETVSWERCNEFIRALNDKLKESGWMYRLPREAEWEYACRGGASSKTDCAWSYYFKSAPTNTLSAQQANFADSALQRTTIVGLYEPNPLGIYDLHGNVWEWCEDAYDGSSRVIRGGSWSDSAENCGAAYRAGPRRRAATATSACVLPEFRPEASKAGRAERSAVS